MSKYCWIHSKTLIRVSWDQMWNMNNICVSREESEVMDKAYIPKILKEIGIPYAYDHFAEGESVDPPFLELVKFEFVEMTNHGDKI